MELEFFLSPQYKLYNKSVEKIRWEFLTQSEKFNTFLSNHLYQDYGNKNRLVIPREWLKDDRITLYKEHEKKISDRAISLFQYYHQFYETAKDEMLIDAV